MGDAYHVKLDAFEGPLDLLLHLINRYEIDIYDIPVAEITEQYMIYIHTMQQLELNIASEYLVMAATLLEIKSKMLIPNQELELEEDEYEEEDPREELMQRLIEYRKYKEAAQSLKDRELDTNQIYTRPPLNLEHYKVEGSQPIENNGEVTIFDMIGALQKVFQRRKWEQPLETRVHRQEIPIQERMEQMMTQIYEANGKIHFGDLFPSPHRSHIVISFIALLELMKKKMVTCEQQENFSDIMIYQMGDGDGITEA
ncbi:segregation/condensation protein A [Salinibacillus xinjiangensis]|uniref:Segregation and condensation protein A n=1 Tax=Salinibacillus xinjiangensis TaxID=1229268 RepID=A0A6G1X6C4_9BACI|nr:segregation/condensation protein A [Salinibacillus xinjiangensis]MRG86456.1 segregation/condensation protein A [Salinibacillus xinjiangensis]